MLFLSEGCTPTVPSKPTKKAIITLEFKNTPLTWVYHNWDDTWNCSYSVVISETNGVGGIITTVKTEIYVGSAIVATNTVSGNSFSPYGTAEIYCNISVSTKHKFDRQVVTAQGSDNNGNSISASKTLTWVWDNEISNFIIKY